MKLQFLLIMGMMCLIGNAQSLSTDLKKVRDMSQVKRQSFKVIYTTYRSVKDSSVDENMNATYSVDGVSSYYYQNDFLVTLKKNNNLLIVDKENAVIYLQSDSLAGGPSSLPELDSMLTKCESIQFLDESDEERTYKMVLRSKITEFKSIEVSINVKQWYVSHIRLSYSKSFPEWENQKIVGYTKPVLEIDLTPISLSKDSSELSFAHYVRVSNGKYIPTKNYNSYEVIGEL